MNMKTLLTVLSFVTIATAEVFSPRVAVAQSISSVTLLRTHQFGTQNQTSPIVVRYNDGRIVASHKLGGGGALYSGDNGQTWSIRNEGGPMELGYEVVLDLGNGEIFSIYPSPFHESGSLFKYQVLRSLDNGLTWLEEWASMDAPLARQTLCPNDRGGQETCAYRFHHGLIKLKDGGLLACGFGNNTGDTTLVEGYPPEWPALKTRLVVMKSSDKGRTWVNPRTIAYEQLPAQEGFNECDMARAVNSDIVLIVRTHDQDNEFPNLPMTPMYMLRSSDEGQTWSAPKAIESFGSNPNILKLDNGLMVASFSGGPGSYIAISANNGETWQHETRLSISDSNTDLIQTGPDTVMVMHYDNTDTILTGSFFRIQGEGPPPLADNQSIQLRGSGLCINIEGPTDTDIGAAPCADTWRQRFIAQAVGSRVRFRLNGTNTCLEPSSGSTGGIHGVSLSTCGASLTQLWESSCTDRWRSPSTGAALVIEPTSASAGKVYGLSGYSGYCNDPLTLISAIPWVTASLSTPLSNNQQIQLRGSGLCINVQGSTDTNIGAVPCYSTWRQRFIAQQSGNLWRFRVNGTNTCLEPTSQPSGDMHPVTLAACGASATQWFERQCTDGWKNPSTGTSLVVDGSTSTNNVFGKVLASPCNDSRTAITPIPWVP